MQPLIATYGLDPHEIEDIGRVAGIGIRVRTLPTPAAAAQTALTDSLVGTVWRLRGESIDDTLRAIAESSAHNASVWHLVRADLSPVTARGVYRLAVSGRDFVRISLRGFDTMGADITDLLNRVGRDAGLTIVSRIPRNLPAQQREIVVAAALIARKRCHVRELAAVCHRSEGTLAAQLRSLGLTSPAALLARTMALHGVWQVEVLERTVKNAAKRMGFGSQQAFSNFVLRHTGHRPRRLFDDEVFARALEDFAASLVVAPASTVIL